MGATRVFELDTDKDRDAQAVFERAQKLQEELKSGEVSDKIYHGAAGYRQFIKPRVSSLISYEKYFKSNYFKKNNIYICQNIF